MQHVEAYFLLGSNLGNRVAMLQQATDLLAQKVGIILIQSAIYETAPWGKMDQPGFLNQVIVVQTHQQPLDLLQHVREIEKQLGRIRYEKWGSRIIDVDILYYGSYIVQIPELIIPHPFIQERRFTLVPLAEISPGFVHPVLKKSNNQLLNDCLDHSQVSKFEDDDTLSN